MTNLGLEPVYLLDIMLEHEASWDFLAELKRTPGTADIPVLVVK